MNIGKKLYKNNIDWEEYVSISNWCNDNNATIEDKDEYYEVVEIPVPTISFEEKKQQKLIELSNIFNEAVKGYFTTREGYLMQFNEHDSNLLNGSITMMENLNQTTGYLTQYNDITISDVDISVMKNVLLQMLQAYAYCHQLKQQYRLNINNATNEQELDDIVIVFDMGLFEQSITE